MKYLVESGQKKEAEPPVGPHLTHFSKPLQEQ